MQTTKQKGGEKGEGGRGRGRDSGVVKMENSIKKEIVPMQANYILILDHVLEIANIKQ